MRTDANTIIKATEAHASLEDKGRARLVRSMSSIGRIVTIKSASNDDIRAVRRARNRTHTLLRDLKAWGLLPESVSVGHDVLSDEKSGLHFPEVYWTRRSGVCVRHWLRIKHPLEQQVEVPNSLQFVTGSCLFGKDGATFHLENGLARPVTSTRGSLPAPIRSLSINAPLSLYELDTACRLGSIIGDLAEGRGSESTHVYVHIPRPEYLLVMFGHQRGRGNHALMKQWLDAVRERGTQVAKCFEVILRASGLTHIETASPLDSILMGNLEAAIMCGETPTVAEIANLIANSSPIISELFRQWLEVRRNRDQPLDYYDLAYFGYVAGVATSLKDKALTIEVDNPSEELIFRETERVLRHTRRHNLFCAGNLMAIYPYEQIAALGLAPAGRIPQASRARDAIESVMTQYGVTAVDDSEAMASAA